MYKHNSTVRSRRDALNRAACSSLLLLAGAAAQAQTTIYNNTNLTDEGVYLGTSDSLWAIGLAGTGSAKYNEWNVSTVVLRLGNANASRVTDTLYFAVWEGINTSYGTGATTVNPTYVAGFTGTFTASSGTYANSTYILPTNSLIIQNCSAGCTIGMQVVAFTNSSLTAVDASMLPAFVSYHPTTGSVVTDYGYTYSDTVNGSTQSVSNGVGWFDGATYTSVFTSANNGFVDATSTANGDFAFGLYNYTSMTGRAVPAPSAVATLILGSTPLFGLLRRRRFRTAKLVGCASEPGSPPEGRDSSAPHRARRKIRPGDE